MKVPDSPITQYQIKLCTHTRAKMAETMSIDKVPEKFGTPHAVVAGTDRQWPGCSRATRRSP